MKPDIGFPIRVVSPFMNNPSEEHLKVVYKTQKYLKKTPDKNLFFKKGIERGIEVSSDVEWVGCYCTYVWGNLVIRKSKKQLLWLEVRLKQSIEYWL